MNLYHLDPEPSFDSEHGSRAPVWILDLDMELESRAGFRALVFKPSLRVSILSLKMEVESGALVRVSLQRLSLDPYLDSRSKVRVWIPS